MAVNTQQYLSITAELKKKNVALVAVSKIKPVEDILEMYQLGQRDFGENYVQELADKQTRLPADIRWHFIGHLQGNKVKYIAPFVHLIQGVDSFKLLAEINKQAQKNNRVIDCLLQVHVAEEETKFGFDEGELLELVQSEQLTSLKHIRITGLMGMASFSDDENKVRSEFRKLKQLFDTVAASPVGGPAFTILSMGMSGDYEMAIEEGSTLVRIGSLLFGARIR